MLFWQDSDKALATTYDDNEVMVAKDYPRNYPTGVKYRRGVVRTLTLIR